MPLESAVQYRTQLDRDILQTLDDVRSEWARMSPWIEGSWNAVGPRVVQAVTAGQRRSARRGAALVAAALAEQGIDPTSELGQFDASTLSGIASDGRPLESLAYQAAVISGNALNIDEPWSVASRSGMSFLESMVSTQVADAFRVASGAQTVATPKATLMVRQVNPGACARCILLAGHQTMTTEAFQRHPKCRCINVPSDRADLADVGQDPLDYFNSLSPAQQDKTFTHDGAQAIRDGADMNQVVNARRGMSKTVSGRMARDKRGRYITNEGTTRRGWAYHQMTRNPKWVVDPKAHRLALKTPRLMPESIYEIATDREDAVRLLKAYGYF